MVKEVVESNVENFIGVEYLPFDSDCPIENVTFEAGCRNNWHIHEGDQILIVTDGRGYYQDEGKMAQELHLGDFIEIPSGTKHWHGAAKDSFFSHLEVEINKEKGFTRWLEAVEDKEYNKLK